MGLLVIVGIAIVGVIIVFGLIMSMWKKVPQDKAGIVSGFRNQRVITGGGTFVFPGLERMDSISLEGMELTVKTTDAMTVQGVKITVESTAIIKIRNTTQDILNAFEQFNTGSRIRETVQSVLEGNLREIIGKLSVEEIYQEREKFSEETREIAKTSLEVMGLELVVFTIREISDQNDYLSSLGAKRIAEVKKDAAIAEAEAEKEKKIRLAEAHKEAEIAKAEADKERTVKLAEANRQGEEARIASEMAVAKAQKDKDVEQAELKRQAQTAKAKADAAYEIEQNKVRKEIIDTQADADILQQQRQKEVADAELAVSVLREQKNIELTEIKAKVAEKALIETMINPAKYAKEKSAIDAEAKKHKDIIEAQARAETSKAEAIVKKEIEVLSAEAEAKVILAKATAQRDAARAQAATKKDIEILSAEADAKAITARATAQRDADIMAAEARSEVIRAEAEAEALGISAKGKAEAEAIREKLEAETDAMLKKAQAYEQYSRYGDAAITQIIADILPETLPAMAQHIAAPLSSIEKLTIWDNGSGNGMLKMTDGVTRTLAATMDIMKDTIGFDLRSFIGNKLGVPNNSVKPTETSTNVTAVDDLSNSNSEKSKADDDKIHELGAALKNLDPELVREFAEIAGIPLEVVDTFISSKEKTEKTIVDSES